jgi:hypothetical protein
MIDSKLIFVQVHSYLFYRYLRQKYVFLFISTFRIDFYMMTTYRKKIKKKNAPIKLISDGKERVKGQ